MDPCWLLLMTFLLFVCLEMASRITCPITFQGTEVRLKVLWVYLLVLLEGRNTIYFLPVFKHLSQSPWLFEDHEETLQWHQPGYTHGCIPSGPMDLCVSSLLMCSLNWSSSTSGMPSLLQTFSLVSRTWDSWRLVLLLKSEVKKAFRTSAFLMSCVTEAPAPFSSKPTFPLACCLPPMYLHKHFLLPLTSLSLAKFNSSWVFCFLNWISACLGSVLIFLSSYLLLFPPSVGFLFVSKFCQELLVHLCGPSGVFAWLPAQWHGLLLTLEVAITEY